MLKKYGGYILGGALIIVGAANLRFNTAIGVTSVFLGALAVVVAFRGRERPDNDES